MGVAVWNSAKYARTEILNSGVTVSIAVVTGVGVPPSLKWKRRKKDGTWPTDAEAVPIGTLSKAEPFDLRQLLYGDASGRVLIGNGKDKFWLTKTVDPKGGGDFETVSVL